jgi:hypothetical protein
MITHSATRSLLRYAIAAFARATAAIVIACAVHAPGGAAQVLRDQSRKSRK